MILIKTSLFPSSKEIVFAKLQRLELLQHIAKPYATFTSIGEKISVWESGKSSSYKFKLFGIIPFGTHTINVLSFDMDNGIYTHEENELVPVWNHRIVLNGLPDNRCLYTDIVEMDAGWKTLFVFLWAKCFYAHRQKRWIKLLKKTKE
jgi:hypothetical protein